MALKESDGEMIRNTSTISFISWILMKNTKNATCLQSGLHQE